MVTLKPPPPVARHGIMASSGENSPLARWQQQADGSAVVDVTDVCRQAAAMLGPDEMIHDAEFSLYSAMSALELMDAKMDKAPPALQPLDTSIASGSLPTNLDTAAPPLPTETDTPTARETHAPTAMIGEAAQKAQTATENDSVHDVDSALSRRALDVLDGMSVCEVAWHEGGSLPETLYACLYLHPITFSTMLRNLGWEPPPLGSEGVGKPKLDLRLSEGHYAWNPVEKALTLVVLAQSLATLRCCSMVRDVILLADIFEEEDFYPSTFGFRLSPPVEDGSVMELLELAMAAMKERIRASVMKNGNFSADECILGHLIARKELLLGCLALRDAFTNKQRQRRLQNLARQRAQKARRREEEEAAMAASANNGDCTTSPKNAKSTINPPTERTESTKNVESTITTELDETERRVVDAAKGLAKLTMCGSPEQRTATDGQCREDAKENSTVEGDSVQGGNTCRFGEDAARACDGARVAVEANGGESLDEGTQGQMHLQGVIVTPTAPPADCALSNLAGDRARETHAEVDLSIQGNAVDKTTARSGQLETSIDGQEPGAVDQEGADYGEDRVDGDEKEVEVEGIKDPLQDIAQCELHLRAASRAFEALFEALLARGDVDSDDGGDTAGSEEQSRQGDGKAAEKASGGGIARDTEQGVTEGKQPPNERGAGDLATQKGTLSKNAGGTMRRPQPSVATAGDAAEPTSRTLGGKLGNFAFEVEMNRHLLGSAPHHHVHFRWDKAGGVRILRVLAEESSRACGVIRCRDLADVRRYLLRFSQPALEGGEAAPGGSMVGTAGLFARSVAAVCLYRQDMILGRFDVMEFVAEAMTDIGVPDAVVTSHAGMTFLARVGKPVYETLRVMCLNRARQRTSLEVQMQDWRVLQEYADTVDEAFLQQYQLADTSPRYMAKWAVCEALGLMHRYLQIGVELQLPSQHELKGTFWYWDYVITTKLMTEGSLWEAKSQLATIKAQMEEERRTEEKAVQRAAAAQAELEAEQQKVAELAASAAAAATKKSSKKKKKGARKRSGGDPGSTGGGGGGVGAADAAGGGEKSSMRREGEVSNEQVSPGRLMKTDREISWEARRERETMDMKLRQFLCRGSVRLLAGLESLKMTGTDAQGFQFTSGEIVHRERYRAFHALDTPEFQEYKGFLAAVAFPPEEAVLVVASAGECFRAARSLAVDLLRRGEQLAADASEGSSGKKEDQLPRRNCHSGTSNKSKIDSNTSVTTTSSSSSSSAAGLTLAKTYGENDSDVEITGIGTYEAWLAQKADLTALAKVSVSNAVVSLQIAKRVEVHEKISNGSGAMVGKAKVEFGVHSQFPVVASSD